MTESETHTGQVKWFNRQTGWGFITVLGTNDDIFVHWRSLNIEDEQFKYLVAGEYVEFGINVDELNKKHPRTAVNVAGIRGGSLMCQFRQTYKNSNESEHETKRTVGEIILGGT